MSTYSIGATSDGAGQRARPRPGPAGAAVTLVEYGDYECPYCGAAHPIVKQLQRGWANGSASSFRNFPLTQIHPHAQQAAEAAEAAGAQGRFWEMHDLLFEHQDAPRRRLTSSDTRDARARRRARSTSSSTSTSHAARVREDFLSGVRSGVNGTPTFFINGDPPRRRLRRRGAARGASAA